MAWHGMVSLEGLPAASRQVVTEALPVELRQDTVTAGTLMIMPHCKRRYRWVPAVAGLSKERLISFSVRPVRPVRPGFDPTLLIAGAQRTHKKRTKK